MAVALRFVVSFFEFKCFLLVLCLRLFLGIRQLQCALLKVALVLGVQFHNSVSFHGLTFPEKTGNGEGNYFFSEDSNKRFLKHFLRLSFCVCQHCIFLVVRK